MNKEHQFVLHHYEPGRFDTRRALEKLHATQHPTPITHHPTWLRVAAAIAAVVVFVGAYALLSTPHMADGPSPLGRSGGVSSVSSSAEAFHFDRTPVSQVLRRLEDAYGVTLVASDTLDSATGQPLMLTADFTPDSLSRLLPLIEQALNITIKREQ